MRDILIVGACAFAVYALLGKRSVSSSDRVMCGNYGAMNRAQCDMLRQQDAGISAPSYIPSAWDASPRQGTAEVWV